MESLRFIEEVVPLRRREKTACAKVERYIKPELLFDFAGQGILVINAGGEIVKINQAAERMLGYEKDELLNMQAELLIAESPDPGYTSMRHEFLFPQKVRLLGTGLELDARRKDGTLFPVEVGLNPIEMHGSRVVIAILVDITLRRAQDDLLRKAHQSLQYYASELKASNVELENFASVSSHDLLEPLRKIRAFGERLKVSEAQGFTNQGRDYLDRMLHASERMEQLINDLLSFSKFSARIQHYADVDLNEILKGVLADLELSIENSGARFETDILPVIEAEPTQMRQLFQNLISNAIKFRKEDVPPLVKISASLMTADDGQEVYEISVSDNGIGFDEKYRSKIFNVFQTLAGRKYEGSGIGLAICRKIATGHGGNISAKSIPGKGSVFTATLPVRQLVK